MMIPNTQLFRLDWLWLLVGAFSVWWSLFLKAISFKCHFLMVCLLKCGFFKKNVFLAIYFVSVEFLFWFCNFKMYFLSVANYLRVRCLHIYQCEALVWPGTCCFQLAMWEQSDLSSLVAKAWEMAILAPARGWRGFFAFFLNCRTLVEYRWLRGCIQAMALSTCFFLRHWC
jgi:hypothetical protein